MQEHINEKSVAIIIKSSKLTGRILAKAIKKVIATMQKRQKSGAQSKHGKQSVKKLIKQGSGISNVEITDSNIKGFERIARKYGIDFALKKDNTQNPTKWLVFFKARDSETLVVALKEFSSKTLKKQKNKDSLIKTLKKMKELAASLTIDKVKNKDRERER